MNIYKILLITIFWLCPFLANAQHVSFEFKKHDAYNLSITAKAKNGWKVYANEAGDIGVPFLLSVSKKNNIDSYQVLWPQHEIMKEEIGRDIFKINYYHDTFPIKIKLQPIDEKKAILFDLQMQYGMCNNICLYEEKLFHIKIDSKHVYVSEHEHVKDLEVMTFFHVILFAIVGGFILNFMPCVLPVLGIKILTLVKSHETKGLSLVTAMGIICSFVVLGIMTIILKFMGESVGWGLQFQNEYFILALIMLFVSMASNYYGDYEIALPRKFANSAYINLKNQYLNSFLSGVVAVVLATPCTAPFLSAALAVALTGSYIVVIATFFAIGFGMAIPFLLVVIAPKLLKLLPRPGMWMVSLKKVFAVFFIATATWLLSILYFKVGSYWVTALAISFIILRFILKTKVRYKFKLIGAFILIWFFALYLSDSNIHLGKLVSDSEVLEDLGDQNHGVFNMWEDFSISRLRQEIANDRPVLVNITAKWCLTCKLNEIRVLDNKKVLSQLHALDVVFLRADYTFKNPIIQEFIKQHNRSGIPLTVVYGSKNKNGIVLSEVLDKKSLLTAVRVAQGEQY